MCLSKRNQLLLVCGALCLLATLFLVRPVPETGEAVVVEVLRDELSLRDGRLYHGEDGAPFTGDMIERYDEGGMKSRTSVFEGLLEGVSVGFYTNRQVQVREHFKASVSHGKRTKWYENGQLLSETQIINGKHHGRFRRWHENGQLAEELNLKEGEADGQSVAFYPSGHLKARVTHAGGDILNQEFWEDGEKLPEKQGRL